MIESVDAAWYWPEDTGLPILDTRLDMLSKRALSATDTAFKQTFNEFVEIDARNAWYRSPGDNIVNHVSRGVEAGFPRLDIGAVTYQATLREVLVRHTETLSIGEGLPPALQLTRMFLSPFPDYSQDAPQTAGVVCMKRIENVSEILVKSFLENNLPRKKSYEKPRPFKSSGPATSYGSINGTPADPFLWENASGELVISRLPDQEHELPEKLQLVEQLYTDVNSL